MNKLPKDKRDKILLVAIFTLAASAAIYFLLISNQRQTLRTVRADAIKSSEQLTRGNNTLQTQGQVSEQYAQATRVLQQREAAMAAANDMYSWLIQTLNNFRAPYRVDIPQFGRGLPSEVGLFPKFPYSAAVFSVRGSAYYHDFGKFLADFENAFPCIRVQNIELTPSIEAGTEASGHEKLTFKMELLTLVRPIAP